MNWVRSAILRFVEEHGRFLIPGDERRKFFIPDEAAVLKRLSSDDADMVSAWRNFHACLKSERDIDRILHIILETSFSAVGIHGQEKALRDAEAEYKRHALYASNVLVFTSRTSGIQGKELKSSDATNNLCSVTKYLENRLQILSNCMRQFPSSAKSKSADAAFPIMLCHKLVNEVGSPHYDFVATITKAVFDLTTAPTPESIRKAFRRDREAKQSIGPPAKTHWLGAS